MTTAPACGRPSSCQEWVTSRSATPSRSGTSGSSSSTRTFPAGIPPASARDLAWLDERLGEEPERPTLLAVHHTPLATGLPGWDAINLTAADREALAAVVARHPQLRAVVGGHLHRIAAGSLAGCAVLSAPSTYLQALPDFNLEAEDVEMVGPPGFALHVFHDGELSSQVEMLSVI